MTPAETKDVNLRAYVELLRADVRAQKVAFITELMEFTDSEDKRSAAVVVQAVRVEQSGTMKGSDKISLKANSISFGGRTYEVVTAYVEAKGSGEGKRSARKIGGGVGLGAIVGGIAGGGQGAAIGAAVGGVTGAVVASQGQEHLNLPAETRLQFQLHAAVTVQP